MQTDIYDFLEEKENYIYNGDCLNVMKTIGKDVDIILTSPFYNTNKKAGRNRNLKNTKVKKGQYDYVRYDVFVDNYTNDEYYDFTEELFNDYDKILKENGVILYNMSYGNENTEVMFRTVSEIITRTNFTVADCIVWKKKTALPNSCSPNKLTRIVEFIYVFVRKGEIKSFKSNKKQVSVRENGQKMYENINNIIEAKNNNGANKFNKATFSTDLCDILLSMYAKENSLVLDSFNGTGTTGVSAIKNGHRYIGIELSENQCKFSVERIKRETGVECNLIKDGVDIEFSN